MNRRKEADMNWHWTIRIAALAAAGILAWILAGVAATTVIQGVSILTGRIQGWINVPQDQMQSIIQFAVWLVIVTLVLRTILGRRG